MASKHDFKNGNTQNRRSIKPSRNQQQLQDDESQQMPLQQNTQQSSDPVLAGMSIDENGNYRFTPEAWAQLNAEYAEVQRRKEAEKQRSSRIKRNDSRQARGASLGQRFLSDSQDDESFEERHSIVRAWLQEQEEYLAEARANVDKESDAESEDDNLKTSYDHAIALARIYNEAAEKISALMNAKLHLRAPSPPSLRTDAMSSTQQRQSSASLPMSEDVKPRRPPRRKRAPRYVDPVPPSPTRN